jgi:hypothetical protein
MILSNMYRFLLLALLPAIAIALYFEGQSYNPALIQFKAPEIGTGTGAQFFPHEIAGYSQAGRVRIFTKENLYEHINGHAEYFITAGFVSLSVGEYVKTGTEPDQPDAVVEIYDMGKSIQAFGVLVEEAGENAAVAQVGMMGFKTPQGLSFFTSKYYVKINIFHDVVPVDTFAESIANKAGVQSGTFSFPLFSRFPELGEVVTTRFIKEAYRGLGFVQNVLEREYSVNGNIVQVFLVAGEDGDIQKLTASFIEFFRQTGIKFVALEKNGRKFYKVLDPYEGDWFLLPLNDVLFGIYGADDDTILNHFVSSSEKIGKG